MKRTSDSKCGGEEPTLEEGLVRDNPDENGGRMVGFPFQVLGVFSLQKSLHFPKFVFPPSSWAEFLFFWDGIIV